ncbi:MAG: hypothetical protein M3275_02655 [Thermoproteota archaeon]|nr:hypothetical protein [Thermoproteota archaeon]
MAAAVFDARTQGLINNLADFNLPVDTAKAKYRIFYDVAIDKAHDVEYPYSFEIIAVPVREDLLRKPSGPDKYASRVIGAINYSTSPKGNRFEGNYKWKKDKKAYFDSEANNIQGILEEYGFSFTTYHNTQSTKLPCIIYANLVSTKLHYIGQSKTEVDTTPFAKSIIKACKAIARDMQTFRVADIRTRDYHIGSSSSYISYRRPTKLVREKKERKSMFKVIEEKLRGRLIAAQEGRRWIGEMHTQQSLWYSSLPLITEYVEEGRLKKPKNRDNFLDQIREVCDAYGVKREDVGIVAAAYSTMYYDGKWSAVNFADIKSLAATEVVIIFIEKEDIVQSLGQYASENGVALVNSRGHLSEYARDLSEVAESTGAHIAILVDYDIPGLHIASKLPGALWLGVDEPMLEHFVITHYDTNYVIPYDPERAIGDATIKRDIQSDPRFAYPRADVRWLKRDMDPVSKGWTPGNKVEIDAVLGKAGPQKLWNYLKEQLQKAFPEYDYTRVIDAYKYAPAPSLAGFVEPQIIGLIKIWIRNRAEAITGDKRKAFGEELKNHPGLLVVTDKVNQIRKELGEIVNGDEQIKNVSYVLNETSKQLEEVIIKAVTEAIEKLDQAHNYGIMKWLADHHQQQQGVGEGG